MSYSFLPLLQPEQVFHKSCSVVFDKFYIHAAELFTELCRRHSAKEKISLGSERGSGEVQRVSERFSAELIREVYACEKSCYRDLTAEEVVFDFV